MGSDGSALPGSGIGKVLHVDITVPDADGLLAFYKQVIGWSSAGLDMGGYEDHMVMTPDGEPAAGICHARGDNAVLPPVWLAYVGVADLHASIAACEAGGGRVISGPHDADGHLYCVIADPTGAALGLMQVPGPDATDVLTTESGY